LGQEQSQGDFEKDRLRDQMVDLKEQNEKVEGLVHFLEEEKLRLQEKVEKTMAAGKTLYSSKTVIIYIYIYTILL